MISVWSVLLLLTLLVVTRWYLRRPRNLPPGLPRFPIIGSLPFLTGDLRKRLTELKDSYGEVSSVYLGGTLVLNGLDIIKETFSKRGQLFADRPSSHYRDHISQGRGIAFSNGEYWKVIRRISQQALKNFGMGTTVIEVHIMEEIDAYMKKMAENNDKSVDLDTIISNAVGNIACSVVLGKRFAYDDKEFLTYINHLKLFHAANQGSILTAFPWLQYIPLDPFGFRKGRAHLLALLSIHQDIITEYKETRSGNKQRDILDVFADRLAEIKKEKNPVISAPDLLLASQELVGTGTETTATTLRWEILFLARHPEIQKQLQDEVDTVIGDVVPKYSMRQELPKVEAYILECLRYVDIGPFAVPHAPAEDTTLNGFMIPKGTMIMANIHGLHHDSNTWGDPDRFRPWRFLTENGKINTDLSSNVLSFSLGKCACLGEALARMELFLFSCRLLQKFTFSPPDGEDLEQVGGNLGLTYMPNPHKIRINLR